MSDNNKATTFADSIKKRYEPLNNNPKFKEKFENETFRILLNPKDGQHAALIAVDKGVLSVNKIENTNKENLDGGFFLGLGIF